MKGKGNTMKTTIADCLRSLLPDFWIMNESYSDSWDAALNRLLDTYEFTNITPYRAKLGSVSVWIANMPYGAFTPEIKGKPDDVRPSRRTIARAMRHLKKRHLKKSGYSKTGDFDNIMPSG